MPIEIVSSSPKAQHIAETRNTERETKSEYPFEELEVGQSFTVKKSEINWKSLRTITYQRNRKFRKADGTPDREFAFILHDDLDLCEVARIV